MCGQSRASRIRGCVVKPDRIPRYYPVRQPAARLKIPGEKRQLGHAAPWFNRQRNERPSAESVEGGKKRYPARGQRCNSSHKQGDKADDNHRHEEDGDKAVACHLSGVVAIKPDRWPKPHNRMRRPSFNGNVRATCTPDGPD